MRAVDVMTIRAGEPTAVHTSLSGPGRSESRTLADFDGVPLRLGTFVAEPGEYTNPGVPFGEWFIVVAGAGELHVEGRDPIRLAPGVVVNSPAHSPQRMTVTEELSKVSLVGL